MEPKPWSVALVTALVAWGGLAGTAQADELDDLRRAVEDQQERIERLESERAERESTPAVASDKLIAGWDNGFFLSSPDGKNKLKLRGYFQTDGRFFPDDDELPLDDEFVLRRVRPILEGTLLGWVDFRVMPDFGRGSTDLLDAYANARFLGEGGSAFQLRVGKFKAPVGLERLQSATALLFVERSLPTELVPNRDIGVMFHGLLFDGKLEYALGGFNGVRDGRNSNGDTSDGKDLAARLFFSPFRGTDLAPLAGLGFGVAGTWGHQGNDDALPAFRAPGSQSTFFSYAAGVQADRQRYRVSPQLYWSWGPAGVLAEYALSSQEVELGAASERLDHQAWQAAVSYVLTGESASFKGVTPERPFEPGTWGPGAWELAARVHQLDVDDDAFPVFADPAASAEEAFAWAVGVNWYWNRWLKFVVNYEQTPFDGGAASGDRDTEHAVLTRLQLAF